MFRRHRHEVTSLGLGNLLWAAFWLTGLSLLVFVALEWLGVASGRFIDWLVGIASFWWLLAIVTVPWNLYFQAREVLAEAEYSAQRGIVVREERLTLVRVWARRSLLLALALHLLSALGLYLLAATGISAVGYLSAGAALLLTGLRPAIRAYRYVAGLLFMIEEELRYPRDDVVTLRTNLDDLTERVKRLESLLNTEDKDSWAAQRQHELRNLQHQTENLSSKLRTLHEENQAAHTRLKHDAQHAIAQIAADLQLLEHVREVVRFFKSA
jgi:gas vesicle protein